jgi:hypothetical protein
MDSVVFLLLVTIQETINDFFFVLKGVKFQQKRPETIHEWWEGPWLPALRARKVETSEIAASDSYKLKNNILVQF